MRRPRILYIYSGTMGFSQDPQRNALWYLSKHLEGDFICVWCTHDEDPAATARAVRPALGDFDFHYIVSCDPSRLVRLLDGAYYVRKGLELSKRRGGFDAIVTYGLYKTGFAGVVLSRLLGRPLIVEVPGNPRRGLDFGEGVKNAAKRRVGPHVVRAVLNRSDHIRLLYPEQIDGLYDGRAPVSVFHNFVPLKLVPTSAPAGDFILFVGFPWNLKGVDTLIRAFQRITERFPETELRIVGYCPDRTPYERLAAGNPRIRLYDPVPNETAVDWMSRARFFVLPSRTEAMGRVLLEAMAARRAIVASAVDGIPHYVEHGANGLLFPVDDDAALADRMAQLLDDPELAERLGREGCVRAHARYSEERYAELFAGMVEETLAGRGGERRP